MTHRRAWRACRGVEFDDALLDRRPAPRGRPAAWSPTPVRTATVSPNSPARRTARPPPRRQSGPASRQRHRGDPRSSPDRTLIRGPACQAAQIAATWRASVPQQPPSDGDGGQPVAQRGVPGAEVSRIALVELRRFVEFGVAPRGGVGRRPRSRAATARRGSIAPSKCARVRAVDHEVGGAAVRRGVHLFDRPRAATGPSASSPSVSTVNEIAAGIPAATAARTMPIASLGVGHRERGDLIGGAWRRT